MNREIERRFLVREEIRQSQAWREAPASFYSQSYLHAEPGCTIRVRRAQSEDETRAWLTIKGPDASGGIGRDEFEYAIPYEDAEALARLACAGTVEKWRRVIMVGTNRWEVDEFTGANTGLLLAEIELESEDQPFERPEWLAQEVTGDSRYANARLAMKPYPF